MPFIIRPESRPKAVSRDILEARAARGREIQTFFNGVTVGSAVASVAVLPFIVPTLASYAIAEFAGEYSRRIEERLDASSSLYYL